jgi:hypothetical protein
MRWFEIVKERQLKKRLPKYKIPSSSISILFVFGIFIVVYKFIFQFLSLRKVRKTRHKMMERENYRLITFRQQKN